MGRRLAPIRRHAGPTILRGSALLLAALLIAPATFSGCLFAPGPRAAAPQGAQGPLDDSERRKRFSARPPIRTSRNLYEGSLWRGAASWGNLMRDHRARYRGDLLTVTDMAKIINVPEAKIEQPEEPQPAEQEGPKEPIDPVIAFLRAQEKRRQRIEAEQNEILRAIESVEVEVVRVLPNGNLLVRGIHPPIFRNQNQVKYVVTLEGIVRPSDVDDNNGIAASKLSKAEWKIRRLVKRTLISPQIADLARAAGRQKEGAFLDRLSNVLTTPSRTRGNQ